MALGLAGGVFCIILLITLAEGAYYAGWFRAAVLFGIACAVVSYALVLLLFLRPAKPPGTAPANGCLEVIGTLFFFSATFVCVFASVFAGHDILFFVVAFVMAVLLTLLGRRDVALGIFLGLGAFLLLMAICSGGGTYLNER